MRYVLAVLALSFTMVAPAAGQSLIPEQGLRFGTLQPGVERRVAPGDPDGAVIFVVGLGRMAIRVLPPTSMTSPEGGVLPLEIGMGDAFIRWLGGSTQTLVPGGTTETTGRLFGNIYIGGTARPSWDQGAGTYTSTIVVQIVAPGT